MIDRGSNTLLVRVWLLGPFHAERRNEQGTWEVIGKTAWEGSYARPLFHRLLCATGRRAARSNLLEELWPNTPLHLAEKYLNNASSKLRQIFYKEIVKPLGHRGIGCYQLVGQSLLWTDIDACELLISEAERLGPSSAEALSLLEQASKDFERGEMLEGESWQWCHALRMQQETLMRYCRICLADAYEQQGMLWHTRIQYRRLLDLNPLDEDALCRFLAFHQRNGLRSDIRTTYEEAKHRFKSYNLPLSQTTKQLA